MKLFHGRGPSFPQQPWHRRIVGRVPLIVLPAFGLGIALAYMGWMFLGMDFYALYPKTIAVSLILLFALQLYFERHEQARLLEVNQDIRRRMGRSYEIPQNRIVQVFDAEGHHAPHDPNCFLLFNSALSDGWGVAPVKLVERGEVTTLKIGGVTFSYWLDSWTVDGSPNLKGSWVTDSATVSFQESFKPGLVFQVGGYTLVPQHTLFEALELSAVLTRVPGYVNHLATTIGLRAPTQPVTR